LARPTNVPERSVTLSPTPTANGKKISTPVASTAGPMYRYGTGSRRLAASNLEIGRIRAPKNSARKSKPPLSQRSAVSSAGASAALLCGTRWSAARIETPLPGDGGTSGAAAITVAATSTLTTDADTGAARPA
jgi:hypothetical protein